MPSKPFTAAILLSALIAVPLHSIAQQRVCIEKAGGVCLKFRADEPRTAPAATPVRPAPPEALEERRMGLDTNEYRAIQESLAANRWYHGAIDGQFGPASRRALRRWQRNAGYPETGWLTEKQADALLTAPIAPQQAPRQEAATAVATPTAPAVEPEPEEPAHPIAGRKYQTTVFAGQGRFEITLSKIDATTARLNVTELTYNHSTVCEVPITGEAFCNASAYPKPMRLIVNLPTIKANGADYRMW